MTIGTLEVSDRELGTLCRKWRISRLALFGSALTGRLGPESDIDLLVDFEPGEQWSLLDLARAEEEFAALFGHRVDLVDKRSLVRSSNWIRRDAIVNSAEVIYGA
jgi:predicted nucleotidyltransferase